MTIKNNLSIIACLTFCALAPAIHAQCPQICDFSHANTGIGNFALFGDTTGMFNTATGHYALYGNNGDDNTATGAFALWRTATGSRNVADGSNALYDNEIGSDNTAIGYNALHANTASYNTATGYQALENNTTGASNSAHGLDTLNSNTTGSGSTANGAYALFSNTIGENNTAIGFDALYNNTTAGNNTAVGFGALQSNTTGTANIALGFDAGFNLTTGSNNIDIGNSGMAGDFARIRIGTRPTHKNTYIAGIFGVTVPTGVAVLVDNSGHLGTTTSSARFKEAIKPMDKASEAILALKPVTFRYKHELDPEGIPQFGLVAEEVEKVNPELVARDDEGKPYTVRYEAVNAMLLNEFLKEHRKVEQQRKDFEAALAQQQKQIDALAEGLQKVSAQFELRKPAPKTVLNNQ
jgi:hypothetical protein